MANEARLSSGCNVADLRQAVDAGTLIDVMEEMTSQDRVREALQIFQGLDSVAFSRSQILLQFDGYVGFKDQANASRLLFNPQFVFGDRRQFSLQRWRAPSAGPRRGRPRPSSGARRCR